MERVIKKMDVEQSETRAPTTRQQLKPSKVRDQRLMDLSANRLTMTADFLPTELDCSLPCSAIVFRQWPCWEQNSFGKSCLSFAIRAICKDLSANQCDFKCHDGGNSIVIAKHFQFSVPISVLEQKLSN